MPKDRKSGGFWNGFGAGSGFVLVTTYTVTLISMYQEGWEWLFGLPIEFFYFLEALGIFLLIFEPLAERNRRKKLS